MNVIAKLRIPFLVALLAACSPLFASTLNWVAGSNLPNPCSNMAVIVDSGAGLMYLVGGNCPTNSLIGFYSSTVAPANWSLLGVPLDTTRISPGAAMDPSVAGQQLVYGGSEGTNSPLNTVGSGSLIDPNNNFNNVASMSVARAYEGYATDGGNAYAIGGIDDQGNVLASMEYFNANGSWVHSTAMPAARWAFPAVDDGAGHIYVFGGGSTTSSASVSNTVYLYTVATKSWSTLTPMPVATRESAAALGPDGNIYVVGGSSGTAALTTVQVYNLASQSWSLGVSLPVALRSAAATVDAQGHLLVLGGIGATGQIVATTWSTQALNQPDSIPVITSVPGLVGNSFSPYSYQATATGNPQPTFALVSGPAGMKLNSATGLITWTPTATQTGAVPVTIQATNRAGSVNQSFTISVEGPPPTAPTGLVEVSATDVTAKVRWNASTVPGGAPIYYRLTEEFCRSGRGGGCSTVVFADNITGTTAVMTGLKPGFDYFPTVSAVANGHVVAGSSASVPTTAVPTPQNLKITSVKETTAVLTWTIPTGTSAAGFKIIGINGTVVTVGNVRSYAITGLTPNTPYSVYMSAFDAYGYQSNGSAAVSFQTISPPVLSLTYGKVAGVVGQGLIVLQSSTASAGVPLVVSTNTLPAPVFSFTAGPKGMGVNASTGAVTWNPVSGTPGSYTATVTAKNALGSTSISFPYTVYAAGSDILAPTQLAYPPVLVSQTATSATISWTAATDNVGVAGYNVNLGYSLFAPNEPTYTVIVKSAGQGTQFTVTGLTTGVPVWMGVAAYDAAGNVAGISPPVMVIP
jgi:hypothetical protein